MDLRRRRDATTGFAACVLGAFVVALAAQDAGQSSSSQQPVFRARTDLVSVYVVAVDAAGQPVHGLTRDDFTLTDRDRPQEIAVFDEIVHAVAPASPEFELPATLKRDVASNNADLGDRLVVVVVDDLHLYKNRTDRAKSIVRDLVAQVGERTPMCLLFSSGKHSLAAITHDQSLILSALDTLKGQKPVPRPPDARDNHMPHFMPDPLDTDARRAALGTAMEANEQDFFDNMSFYKTLEDAARILLADDSRRKAFVVVSEGIGKDLSWLPTLVSPCDAVSPLNQVDPNSNITPCYHDRAILGMMQSLRRSNVATYAVDPRGEVQSKDLMRECMPSPAAMADDPCFMGLTDWGSQVRQAQHGLEITAEITGGFAVTNTDDFAGGIKRIISDLDNYYLLGFYPDDTKGNGFRELGVSVATPGITLRFRQGYEVGSPPPPPKGAKNPLAELALGMVAKPDLPLRMVATTFPGNGNVARVAASIEVSVPRRDIEDAEGRVSDQLKYSLFVADMKNGKIVKELTNTANVSSQKPLGESAPSTVSYQMPMTPELPPGRYQLRASAMSAKLSRSGSVYLDVEVPDFTKSPIAVSGLAVGYAGEPHVPAAHPPNASRLIPFDPSLDREFHATDTIRVFFQVAPRGSTPVKITIELIDHEDKTVRTIDEARAPAEPGQVDVKVPLDGLTPGAFRVRATASDGKTSATAEVGIVVAR